MSSASTEPNAGAGSRLKGQREPQERQPLDARVRYEGVGSAGMEIMGGVMGYFMIARTGEHAKEVAVTLNEPALEYLAAELGVADTPAFREQAVRTVGQLWLEKHLANSGHGVTAAMISRHTLEAHPDLVSQARPALAANRPS